jgi:hypothetical protein
LRRKKNKKFIRLKKNIISAVILSVLFQPLSANSAVPPLSDSATVSLVTSSPVNEAVYTRYGHAAIRVKDSNFDLVFNYGIFDLSKSNFIYHFVRGETDYRLDAYEFRYELSAYRRHGSSVCEQVLNLLPGEKEALWQALALNALPENRVYRYNFFFDNCATRPIAMIEKSIDGRLDYRGVETEETFRHAINYLTREYEWMTLGCDLVLGLPTDRIMTRKERLFLPENLKDYLNHSVIVRGETSQPAVLATNMLAVQQPGREQKIPVLSSPLACFCLLFAVLLLVTWMERSMKRYFRIVDGILFFVAGMAGCIIFFLSFFSEHPCTFPNINLLWLHPFHLAGVIFISTKKIKKSAFRYHAVNLSVIFAMCVAWLFIPQHFNPAFIPLIAGISLRSGWALLRGRTADQIKTSK